MERLYYLQQKLGMTQAEAVALATVLGLFLLGSGVRLIGPSGPTFDDETYAEVDSLFAAGVQSITSMGRGLTSETDSTAPPATSVTRVARGGPGVVDLNRAGRSELQSLPGIGPALADRIIEHREVHGAFGSVSELTAVRGIGPKTLERMRPHLVASSPE